MTKNEQIALLDGKFAQIQAIRQEIADILNAKTSDQALGEAIEEHKTKEKKPRRKPIIKTKKARKVKTTRRTPKRRPEVENGDLLKPYKPSRLGYRKKEKDKKESEYRCLDCGFVFSTTHPRESLICGTCQSTALVPNA